MGVHAQPWPGRFERATTFDAWRMIPFRATGITAYLAIRFIGFSVSIRRVRDLYTNAAPRILARGEKRLAHKGASSPALWGLNLA